ncbi:hypothetical protein An11g08740 [Aspergillus niger]|uniref:Uncharacterized protein n=2 Tax=Aspergillus niger TaxID=5061 RepID=A2QXF2_ASPNC|nr:hypothetical protein An11g08740 [Aspergillus niger]CAK46060.1 hypothetical protein An11g08740 [Aspergillus niger]
MLAAKALRSITCTTPNHSFTAAVVDNITALCK